MITVFSKGAPQLGYITDDNKSVVMYNGYYCTCSKVEVAEDGSATVYLHATKGVADQAAPLFTNNYFKKNIATFTVKLLDVVVIAEGEVGEDVIPDWKKEENAEVEVDETVSTSITVAEASLVPGAGEESFTTLKVTFSESVRLGLIEKIEVKVEDAAGELIGHYDFNNNKYAEEGTELYEKADSFLELKANNVDGTYASSNANPSWRVYVPVANDTDVAGAKLVVDAVINGNASTLEVTL